MEGEICQIHVVHHFEAVGYHGGLCFSDDLAARPTTTTTVTSLTRTHAMAVWERSQNVAIQ